MQEVYSLHQTNNRTTSRLIVSHDVGNYCVSNMAVWTLPTDTKELKQTLKNAPDKFQKQVRESYNLANMFVWYLTIDIAMKTIS